MVKVKESEKRFGIETQTQDILDELLAEYPSDKRTRKVLNNIHILIERFKQLRRKFSDFDETGNAEHIKKGANYKPLINNLKELNKKLWEYRLVEILIKYLILKFLLMKCMKMLK